MDCILHGLSEFTLPYLSNVATWEEHVRHLQVMLNRLKEAGLTVKPAKWHLSWAKVASMGHIVRHGQHRSSEIKVGAFVNYLWSTTRSEVKAFSSWILAALCKTLSSIASFLADTLWKSEPVKVTRETKKENTFHVLKQHLSEKPILMVPDFSKGFIIEYSASDCSMRAVLFQKDC